MINRPKKPRVQHEHALQAAAAAFLDLALPLDAVWTAIGHGGGGKARGRQLKARGLKKGFPDHLIFYRNRLLFIEFKSSDGRLSDEQVEMHQRLRAAGAMVVTCRSVEEVEFELKMWNVPLRATVMAGGGIRMLG